MKTIKPDKISVLIRTVELRGKPRFIVSLIMGFRFDQPRALLSEVEMWKLAGEALSAEMGVIDEGNVKVRGEVLAAGRCYPPGGEPSAVSFVHLEVGSVDKRLAVIGDREWKHGLPTEPVPFESMPVDWAHSFGGEGFERNPRGKGVGSVEDDDDKAVRPLPNIEDPRRLVKAPRDRPEPAGFGAHDFSWPQRFSKTGTYDGDWLENHAPGYAEDMDPTIFNCAPPDQWIDGYFSGDETFLIENMHPTQPRIEGKLPPLRTRIFVTHRQPDGEEAFVEIATRLDTLRFFPNHECALLIYRGVLEVAEDDAHDIVHLMLAAEDPDHPRDVEHYQRALALRLDKEQAALAGLRDEDLMPPAEAGWEPRRPKSDLDAWVKKEDFFAQNLDRKRQKTIAAAREKVIALGLDPKDFQLDEPPVDPGIDADDPEAAMEQLAQLQQDAAELQEQAAEKIEEARALTREQFARAGIDYDEAVAKAERDASGPPDFDADQKIAEIRQMLMVARAGGQPLEEMEQQLEDPAFRDRLVAQQQALREVYRRGAHLQRPYDSVDLEQSEMFRAELEVARHNDITLEERDYSGADLSGMDLSGMNLSGIFLESSNLTDTNLEGANLEGAVLAHARLERTKLGGANLDKANLGGATIVDADLSGCSMLELTLSGARLRNSSLRGVSLSRALLMDVTFEEGVDFGGATTKDVVVLRTDLRGLSLRGAQLVEATFVEVDAREVDFCGADLSRASFVMSQLDGALFREATLERFNCVLDTTLAGADFRRASMRQAQLRKLNLQGARFSGADLTSADLSEADLTGADLSGVRARQALFIRTNFYGAQLEGADLLDAILQKARLFATNLRGANLFGADLTKVLIDGETNIDKTNMKRARVHPRGKASS